MRKTIRIQKEELVNQSIKTIFKDEESIFDNHQTIITQTHQKKNKEKIIAEVKYNKIIHNNKEAIIIVSNDITKSIEHLNKIENQNEKLKDIAWIQSHIVRAPLTNILGLIKLINETESVNDKELLHHLNQSILQLENSINEIVNKTHIR